MGPAPLPRLAVVEAVAAAAAAGIAFGFATGRMRLAAERVWDALRCPGPHVLHNGAEVRFEGRTVHSWPLDDEHVEAVLAVGNELGAYAEIYVEDGYLITTPDSRARPHWELLGCEPLAVARSRTDVPGPVLKATFALFDAHLATTVVGRLGEHGMKAGQATSPITPGILYVNATHPDADKGLAMTAGAAAAGCSLTQTVAIGDAHNDVSMFEVAGTAIAMGQAPDEVKAAAHLVAPPVDDDGAAVAIAGLLAAARAGANDGH